MDMDVGTTYATAAQRGPLEARRRRPRVRDWIIGIFAGAIMALLFGHGLAPEADGIALVIESFLPWLGAAIAALLMAALLSKAWFGAIPVVVAAVSWTLVFLPVLMTGAVPASAAGTSDGAAEGLTVVTQNLRAGNPDAEAAVEKLIESDADVVVLQELTGPALARITPLMDGTFGHRQLAGTVGVWSRFPLGGGEPLTLGLGWSRAVSVQLETPAGPVQLYAVHLPSVRPGEVSSRNSGLAKLTEIVEADPSPRILVVGDFNTANTDRAFAPLLATLDEARAGFGFTWPARYPATRPDHILFRGFTITGASVIASPGTDHLAALARLQPGTVRPPATPPPAEPRNPA
ncbi:endonuclease/exonuclease/phosphatase family protein [Arthrobacter sp. UYEF20]|uniref:endonuclease/exonuclease/phosphatase family protein n=1 Tax=Arthrobacter sp. UYEF20 TaxID=1756363 RepID=UPI003392C767